MRKTDKNDAENPTLATTVVVCNKTLSYIYRSRSVTYDGQTKRHRATSYHASKASSGQKSSDCALDLKRVLHLSQDSARCTWRLTA